MTKPPAMPELPEPDYWSTRDDDTPLYTADQMRAYALAALQSAQPAAAVSDAEIDRILSAPIPGGSVASHWFLPHDTDKGLANVRDVVRAMLTSARAILALRPQAVPMTDERNLACAACGANRLKEPCRLHYNCKFVGITQRADGGEG